MIRASSTQDYRTNGMLDLYLCEIKDDRLLSAAEECELAEAIARGDKEALARMIRSNLRLVVKIAQDHRNQGLAFEDLIGEGNLGLIRACKDFDPAFGTRFSTYASHWIKQSIRAALINTTALIRRPAHMEALLYKRRKAERLLCRELGRTPTEEQIDVAQGLTKPQKTLVSLARRAAQVRQESCADDESGWTADESVDPRDSADAAFEKTDELEKFLLRLDRLDEEERFVLTFRFGLGANDVLTLKQIGRILGVTREWVRKLELRAMAKLKDDYVPPAAPIEEAPAPKRRKRRDRSVRHRNTPDRVRADRPEPRPGARRARSRVPAAVA